MRCARAGHRIVLEVTNVRQCKAAGGVDVRRGRYYVSLRRSEIALPRASRRIAPGPAAFSSAVIRARSWAGSGSQAALAWPFLGPRHDETM